MPSPVRAPPRPGFDAKSVRQRNEKAAIVERAAKLIEPHTAVALSAGTTTAALALVDVPGLTIVTNSIPVADTLYRRAARRTVVLTSGIRTPSDALAGPVAEAAIGSLNVDVLFLGVHGMSPHRFHHAEPHGGRHHRLMVSAARRLVVLADHTKWEMVGIATITPLDEADILITDVGLAAEARVQLASASVNSSWSIERLATQLENR